MGCLGRRREREVASTKPSFWFAQLDEDEEEGIKMGDTGEKQSWERDDDSHFGHTKFEISVGQSHGKKLPL